jgi:hypothetical protein
MELCILSPPLSATISSLAASRLAFNVTSLNIGSFYTGVSIYIEN